MKNLILLFSVALIGFSCAKKENGNNVNPVNQFAFVNNQCVNQTNGQPADPSLCNNINNGYTFQNGICIQTANGLQVQPSLCQNAGASAYSCIVTATGQPVPSSYCQSNTGYGQQCYGAYIYNQNGVSQQVQCAGANCRGYTLVSQTNGQQVTCQ